jgi:DNA polymerase-3 subunit gamma/tau
VEHLRNLLVVKISSDPATVIELPAADIEAIKRQAAGAESERLLMLFDSLSKTLDDMRWSPHQRFTFEVGLIRACSLASLRPLGEILGNIKELEARFASDQRRGTLSPSSAHRIREDAAVYTPSSRAEAAPAAAASTAGSGGVPEDVWKRIITVLKSKKPGLASFLEHSTISSLSETELVIGVKGNSFQIEQLEKPENRTMLERVIEEVLSRKIQVKVQAVSVAPKAGGKAAHTKKAGPGDQDPAVQDVLRIFPEGEVIE